EGARRGAHGQERGEEGDLQPWGVWRQAQVSEAHAGRNARPRRAIYPPADARSCAGLRHEHGGAPDLALAQRLERGVRLFQRKALHFDTQLRLAGEEAELLSVAPGEVRDGAHAAPAPATPVRAAGDGPPVDAAA